MTKRESPLNVAERIRLQIEESINGGVLLPGDALDENAIAEQFGVSRTPVREAVLHLSSQGLVKVVPRSGIFVARMSIKELLAMFELLSELEGASAKLATNRMTSVQRQRLERIHAESRVLVDTGDATRYEQANADFHGVLYEACLNGYLCEQIRSIRYRTQAYRRDHFQDSQRLEKSWEDHARVVEAILARNDRMASQAMIDHIAIGGREFAEFVARIPEALLES